MLRIVAAASEIFVAPVGTADAPAVVVVTEIVDTWSVAVGAAVS
jgi:hypothetical protein